ncbi:hypothetical protein R1sor_008352 [Riccia sorocarpa]|uniref:CCHC-type domain-containing protein n=1 Tax=Riccia sorocarpa TaxID=122646 RepID=A0ABD3HVA4_9MARC
MSQEFPDGKKKPCDRPDHQIDIDENMATSSSSVSAMQGGTLVDTQFNGAQVLSGNQQKGAGTTGSPRRISLANDFQTQLLGELEKNNAVIRQILTSQAEGCFTCHKTYHIARFCPATTKTKVVTQEVIDEAISKAKEAKEAEEHEKSAASENSSHPTGPQSNGGIPTQNTFEQLGSEEENDEEMEEDMDPPEIGTQPGCHVPDLNNPATEATRDSTATMDYSYRQKRQGDPHSPTKQLPASLPGEPQGTSQRGRTAEQHQLKGKCGQLEKLNMNTRTKEAQKLKQRSTGSRVP